MSFNVFVIYFALSSAAIAVWIDVRFPRLAPGDLRAALVRLAMSFVAVQLTLPAASFAFRPYSPVTEAFAIATAGYVALTFAMLTTFWLVRVAQRMLGGSVR